MQEAVISRNRTVIRYNLAGILMNLLLASAKIIAGILIHSHAILLDGVNSLSDLISSTLSIISAVFGSRKTNQAHPFGYGRIEYIFSMLITLIVMSLGVQSLIYSVIDIFRPSDPPAYDLPVVVIMSVSMVCKAVYGIALRKKGKEIRSTAMIMTGTESLGDSLVSVSILVAIAVYRLTGADIEHYLGIGIALLILLTGIRVMAETMAKILGTRADPDLKKKVIRLLAEEEGVENVTSLILHNYGETVYVGSAHINVGENMRAADLGSLSRTLIRKAKDAGVTLTDIGISGVSLRDSEKAKIWDTILELAMETPTVVRVHSFEADLEKKTIDFCIVQDFSVKKQKDYEALLDAVRGRFPEFRVEIFTSPNA